MNRRDKDGLDAIDDLMRAAEVGANPIDADDLLRFKGHGPYEHNAKDGHLMPRVNAMTTTKPRRHP